MKEITINNQNKICKIVSIIINMFQSSHLISINQNVTLKNQTYFKGFR